MLWSQHDHAVTAIPSMSRLLSALPKVDPYTGKNTSVTLSAWVMQFTASLAARALGVPMPDQQKLAVVPDSALLLKMQSEDDPSD